METPKLPQSISVSSHVDLPTSRQHLDRRQNFPHVQNAQPQRGSRNGTDPSEQKDKDHGDGARNEWCSPGQRSDTGGESHTLRENVMVNESHINRPQNILDPNKFARVRAHREMSLGAGITEEVRRNWTEHQQNGDVLIGSDVKRTASIAANEPRSGEALKGNQPNTVRNEDAASTTDKDERKRKTRNRLVHLI